MPGRSEGSSKVRLQRRRFLGAAAGLTVAADLGGCTAPAPPSEAKSTPPAPPAEEAPSAEHFVVHGERPLTKETLRGEAGASVVTPNDRFFVRNNLPMPPKAFVEDRGRWGLQVRGTREERTFTLDHLKSLGMESVATVLQCSGNGRKFFEHGPSGSPWGVGAAGCAVWVGLPVRLLVDALGGVGNAARFLTSTGGEVLPEAVDPEQVIVERSIPVDKALDDCLLAWEMNGEPLPLNHGGPLRLIVPGYFGCNNIKYVKRLSFTETQTKAKIQNSGYRLRPIGEKGGPDQPSMWQMNVKSWVNGPGAGGHPIKAGATIFHGVAFSGGEAVTRVEWSMDDGKTWADAKLIGPDLGRYAWRQFTFSAELPVGTHRVFSRAHDAIGETQPERRVENERGYGNNSWRDHGLEVVASAAATASAADPAPTPAAVELEQAEAAPMASPELDAQALRGRAAVLNEAQPACGACHGLEEAGLQGAVGPALDGLAPTASRVEAAVTNGVGAMPAYGETLSEATIKDIAHYIESATRGPK